MKRQKWQFMRCKMFGHFCVWVPCRLATKRKKGKDADYISLDFKQSRSYRRFLRRRYERGFFTFANPLFRYYEVGWAEMPKAPRKKK
ncbi:hypothetical protein [Fibrobacter sp. UWH4]|uniref:hypothetical protein n=1 Tax=Fibrobacter sp. UWH4 TaxID=1896210 RepID=UPI000917D57A|nr:hypothetical protein [Fibrobacter sp. UWH4]SHL06363.1 hypothetical protein SAMN05720762_10491 [Fibrobacter sp. UWH4]